MRYRAKTRMQFRMGGRMIIIPRGAEFAMEPEDARLYLHPDDYELFEEKPKKSPTPSSTGSEQAIKRKGGRKEE